MIGGLLSSVSRRALVATAALFASGVATQAADLGGNCCADLEERVAELEATTARKGNRKVSLTVSGEVAVGIMWHNVNKVQTTGGSNALLGETSGDMRITDLGSKFGFKGSAEITQDVSAGFQLDFGTNWNVSKDSNRLAYGFNQNAHAIANDGFQDIGSAISISNAYLYLQSKQLGKLTAGFSSMATDGIAEINIASTEGFKLFNANTLGSLRNGSSNTGSSSFDGNKRNTVRYDTPSISGFSLAASLGQRSFEDGDFGDLRQSWDVTLRYAGEFSGFRIAAGIGYREDNRDASSTVTCAAPPVCVVTSDGPMHVDNDKTTTGSVSLMHVTSGLFITGGYGDFTRSRPLAGEVDGRSHKGWGVMGGIEQKFNTLGTTTLWGGYWTIDPRGNNTGAPACVGVHCDSASTWGVGLTQKIDAAATTLFITYQSYDNYGVVGEVFCVTANCRDDFQSVVGGMKIQF